MRTATMVLASVIACANAGTQAHAAVIDRVLAIVDGHLITLSDLRAATTLGLLPRATSGRDAALERWIDRVLVLQEVDRFAPPDPTPEAIAARVTELQRGWAGQPAAALLSALGVDERWLQQWARDDLRIEAYIDQRFAGSMEPTEEELENYYRQHRAEFGASAGDAMPAAAQALARQRVTAERRAALIADWLTSLRRRADIVRTAATPP